jgi:putative ABC transport system permease protein
MSLLSQCGAITSLNLKSIPQRAAMSVATVAAVAMAVAVLLGFLALSEGFRRTVQGGGAENIAIVLRKGSESELNSILTPDQARLIATAPGIVQRNGVPDVSGELYVVVDGTKRSTGGRANITLRGVGQNALSVRPQVNLAEGRLFAPGSNEVVVGRGLIREFAGFNMGDSIRLAGNNWRVVGVFEAPGTVFESELWGDARVIQGAFQRGSTVQVVRAVMAPGGFERFKAFVENDPRLNLAATTERDFYQSQAGGTSDLIGVIGVPLAIVMAIGALAGALNTMYSSVSARGSEIATLRIIGFSGTAALVGTMAEALALSLIGALVGAGLYFVFFNGMTTSTVSQGSFSQVVFQLALTPALVVQAVIMALIIGFVGGFFPGLRAARQSPHLELAQG